MHSLKVLARARHSLHKLGAFPHRRSFSALPHYASSDDPQDQVLVDGRAKSRTAILNRPSARNSLTTSMVARLKRLYESWEENPNIGFVLMKSSGKAFCSGGDVVTLYHLLTEGNIEECRIFFDALYKFLAILDGVTMASGAGISLPGMFRLATDKTVNRPEIAKFLKQEAGTNTNNYTSHDPSTQIREIQQKSFFHLSRLPGYLGEHPALPGDKLNGVEMVACRLATHYSLNARLALIEECLGRLTTDDPSVIETSLSQYGDLVYPDRKSIIHKIEVIDKCFSNDTVEEIIHALVSWTRDPEKDSYVYCWKVYNAWHHTGFSDGRTDVYFAR
ncbi:hypothetical protein BT93_C1611 [Corymbia citriodora subsp. variegata]|nr:hypothetical protein BT93_C1611 [Corymbia citriodora subsp. variegata]